MKRTKLQFSLRSMLVITTGVGVFFGLVGSGWHSAAFWYLVGSGFGMMVVDIALGRGSRSWTCVMLLAGIFYAAANIVVFNVTMSIDHGAIFEFFYVIPVVFGAPGLMVIASIVVASLSRQLHWLGLLGFAIWIGCVGFAHLWVIAEVSASC
jgi:hypothetical protein